MSSSPAAVGTIATRARREPMSARIPRSTSAIAGVNSPEPQSTSGPRVTRAPGSDGIACTCDRDSCGCACRAPLPAGPPTRGEHAAPRARHPPPPRADRARVWRTRPRCPGCGRSGIARRTRRSRAACRASTPGNTPGSRRRRRSVTSSKCRRSFVRRPHGPAMPAPERSAASSTVNSSPVSSTEGSSCSISRPRAIRRSALRPAPSPRSRSAWMTRTRSPEARRARRAALRSLEP